MIDSGILMTGGCRVDLVRPDGVVITAHVSLAKQPFATFVEVAMTEKKIPTTTPYKIMSFCAGCCRLRVELEA